MTPKFKSAVERRFTTVASDAYSDLLLLYPNRELPEGVETFAAIHIIASEETLPIGLGATARSRNVGVIQIDVFGPVNRGVGDLDDITMALTRGFHRLTLEVPGEGWAVFREGGVPLDRGEVQGRYKYVGTVPYRYDFTI